MNKLGEGGVAKKKVKVAASTPKKSALPSKSPMSKNKSGLLKPPKSTTFGATKSSLQLGQDSLLRDTKRSDSLITYSNTEKIA